MQFLIGFILGFGLAFVMFYKPAREWVVKRNKVRREAERQLEADKPIKVSAIKKKKYDKAKAHKQSKPRILTNPKPPKPKKRVK